MFDEYSKIVRDYVLLIRVGEKELSDVPDFQNLRKVVSDVLAKSA